MNRATTHCGILNMKVIIKKYAQGNKIPKHVQIIKLLNVTLQNCNLLYYTVPNETQDLHKCCKSPCHPTSRKSVKE